MKHSRTIIGIIAFCAAVFLVGCGEQPVSETSSSSVETSTSSVETSSSSAESSASSSDLNVENPMDINDILDPELNTIDTSKPIVKPDVSEPDTSEPNSSESSSNSDTSDSSQNSNTSKPTSEPTSDTHEPTSEPTASSSQPTTSQPTGETSKPTSSSSSSGGTFSSSTGGNTSPYWNPDAPGNKPGPYGGYYDANGTLHAIKKNVPKDADGYSVISYTDEYGVGHMTKAEKEKAREEEQRIDNGGLPDTSGLDLSGWTW